jgi:transposase-like protein
MAQTKGKIPREDWREIAGRAAQGEALASIARTYGCTAPAIRYVLNRLHATDQRSSSSESSSVEAPGSATTRAYAVAVASKREPIAGGALRSLQASASALRESVYSDIAAFLVAFDAVMDDDTEGARQALIEATDRLMRAGARTRLEMERRRLHSVDQAS